MPGAPKVTYKMVVAIREDKVGGDWTNKQLAARYGVSAMTVSRITTGDAYPDFPGPITPKRELRPRSGRRCWRGHHLPTTNITYGTWTGCLKCKQIRNREYMRKRRARTS